MSTSSTDPQGQSVSDLEREVEQERKRVSETIDALQSRASASNVLEQVVKAVSENGGEVSRNLGRTLRDNPLPAILTGVGLAWLMAGTGGGRQRGAGYLRDERYPYDPEWDDEDDVYVREEGIDPPLQPYDISSASGRRLTSGEFDQTSSDLAAAGRTTLFASEQAPSYTSEQAPSVSSDWGHEKSRTMGDRAREMGERARDASRSVGSRIGSGTSAVSGGLHAGASRAGEAMRGAGDAVRGAGDAARLRAQRARYSAMQASREGRDSLANLMHDQPLVFGALAAALGAAFGGVLPASRAENRLFGEQSARLKDTARRVAETESAKATAVAEAMAREAVNMTDEAAGRMQASTPGGKEAVEKAEAGVRSAVNRVAEAGRAEAERQHLGEGVGKDVGRSES
jgi:Protein of unknown function (DUF3618)